LHLAVQFGSTVIAGKAKQSTGKVLVLFWIAAAATSRLAMTLRSNYGAVLSSITSMLFSQPTEVFVRRLRKN